MKAESVVYCEGYFDRAFWKGWLEHLGCANLFAKQQRVIDPWNLKVGSGEFGFRSPGQIFLRIVPCRGKENVLNQARLRLEQRETKPIRRMVINWDADTLDLPSLQGPSPRTRLGDLMGCLQPGAAADSHGDYVLDGEVPTTVSLLPWECPDSPRVGIPAKQTLERLCSAAILEAYPNRGQSVADWLDSRPGGPPLVPKSFSWSYMAGWYPDHNCEAFFELLWKDPLVAAALRSRLEATGAWRVAAALAEG